MDYREFIQRLESLDDLPDSEPKGELCPNCHRVHAAISDSEMAESVEIMGIALVETFKANLAGNPRFSDAFLASSEYTGKAFAEALRTLLKDMSPYLRGEAEQLMKMGLWSHLNRFLEEIKQ